MKNKNIFFTLLIILLVASCTPSSLHTIQATSTVSVLTQTDELPLSLQSLKNSTYSGIYEEPITLMDGIYEIKSSSENDSTRTIVEYMDGSEIFGDINGDWKDDAVVFLVERGGGSGAFVYVSVQLNQNGQPLDAGAVRIEDRVGVQASAIENNQVVLDIITQGPGDVACCSTHKARNIYELQEGKLVETFTQTENLVRISIDDLNGTTWTLVEIDMEIPLETDTPINIKFQDSQLSGNSGCNSYEANFTLNTDNPLIMDISSISSTRKKCPDPVGSQEIAFISALDEVSHWGYHYGKLALFYKGDGKELSRLLFISND